MPSSTATRSNPRFALWCSTGLGCLLSAVAWWVDVSITVYQVSGVEAWWASLPYSWHQSLSFLMLPGWLVWWGFLNVTKSELVAVALGFATNAAEFALLLYVPILLVKLLTVARPQE